MVVAFFFYIKVDWFKDLQTGREINYLNISNALSALRFIFVPVLIVMFGLAMKGDNIIYEKFSPLKVKLILFLFGGFVCLTDLFDGYFARKFNEVTKIGQILDPIGDFLMITCFSTMLFHHKMIHWWFFLLVLIRIPGIILAMLCYPLFKVRFKILSSFMGKVTVAFLVFFLAYCILGLLFTEWRSDFNQIYYCLLFLFQIIGAGLMVISFVEKGIIFVKYCKEEKRI